MAKHKISEALMDAYRRTALNLIKPTKRGIHVMSRSVFLIILLLLFGPALAGELPDSMLTPGVTNPDVTQDNIQDTICVKGFTKTVRPPANYTNRLKKKQLVQYGYKHANPQAFEEDHLIPLGVGGNPTDHQNVWPQPRKGQWSAAKKDKLENKLHELVCNGNLSLEETQQDISRNWIEAYKKYVSPGYSISAP